MLGCAETYLKVTCHNISNHKTAFFSKRNQEIEAVFFIFSCFKRETSKTSYNPLQIRIYLIRC